jgi:hypothetical protein
MVSSRERKGRKGEWRRGGRALLTMEEGEGGAWGKLLGALGLLVSGATVFGSYCCAFSVHELEEKEKREKKKRTNFRGEK